MRESVGILWDCDNEPVGRCFRHANLSCLGIARLTNVCRSFPRVNPMEIAITQTMLVAAFATKKIMLLITRMNLSPHPFLRRECIPFSMLSNKIPLFDVRTIMVSTSYPAASLWMTCKLLFFSSVQSCSYWWILPHGFLNYRFEHHTWPDLILWQL